MFERFIDLKVIASLVLALLLCSMSAHAQSNDVKSPAVLKSGLNKATIDSFGSEQFWTFTAAPGHFRLVFTRSTPQEGFSVGSKVGVGAVFAPKTADSTLTYKESPAGTIFDGAVKQPTRVIVMIEPAKSPLVRQTNDYTLEASGDIASSADASHSAQATSVVGVYNAFISDFGAVKFVSDGSIVTTSGASGTWELFDADTRTYIVVISGNRLTLTFQPGRGFVDKNQQLVFQVKPHA